MKFASNSIRYLSRFSITFHFREIRAVTDRIEISILLLTFDYFLVVLENIERKLPPVFGIENALLCVG